MATLNELISQIKFVETLYEDGEIDKEHYNDTIESMNVTLEDKVDGYGEVIKSKQGEIAAIDERIKELQARKQSTKNSVERMKDNLLDALQQTNKQRVKTALFTVYKQKTKSVSLKNESELPTEYLIPQPAKVDKKAIKAALEDGKKIDGATLVEKEGLRIR